MDVLGFVERDYERVVRSVTLATGDREGAVEAVHEAIAQAIERQRRGDRIEHLAAWVVVVASNRIRRRWRRDGYHVAATRRLEPLQHQPGLERVEAELDVFLALAELPVRQRQVVVLHYFHDLDVATIAYILRVHSGTVKTALFRARATLAEHLSTYRTEEQV